MQRYLNRQIRYITKVYSINYLIKLDSKIETSRKR